MTSTIPFESPTKAIDKTEKTKDGKQAVCIYIYIYILLLKLKQLRSRVINVIDPRVFIFSVTNRRHYEDSSPNI